MKLGSNLFICQQCAITPTLISIWTSHVLRSIEWLFDFAVDVKLNRGVLYALFRRVCRRAVACEWRGSSEFKRLFLWRGIFIFIAYQSNWGQRRKRGHECALALNGSPWVGTLVVEGRVEMTVQGMDEIVCDRNANMKRYWKKTLWTWSW